MFVVVGSAVLGCSEVRTCVGLEVLARGRNLEIAWNRRLLSVQVSPSELRFIRLIIEVDTGVWCRVDEWDSALIVRRVLSPPVSERGVILAHFRLVVVRR